MCMYSYGVSHFLALYGKAATISVKGLTVFVALFSYTIGCREVHVRPQAIRKTHVLTIAITGIYAILFSVLIAVAADIHMHRIADTPNSFQKTAHTTLGCLDYDTILSANYNQQLEVGYATISQMTTRVPGQNQALLNFEYNTIASEAYSLYTSALSANNCTPSESAPAALSPALAPDYSFNPSNLDPDIPLTCNRTVALQYIDTYTQQYIRNMQNEQSTLTNFISNYYPQQSSLTLRLRQGATSIQASLSSISTGLIQTFNSSIGNVGC